MPFRKRLWACRHLLSYSGVPWPRGGGQGLGGGRALLATPFPQSSASGNAGALKIPAVWAWWQKCDSHVAIVSVGHKGLGGTQGTFTQDCVCGRFMMKVSVG